MFWVVFPKGKNPEVVGNFPGLELLRLSKGTMKGVITSNSCILREYITII